LPTDIGTEKQLQLILGITRNKISIVEFKEIGDFGLLAISDEETKKRRTMKDAILKTEKELYLYLAIFKLLLPFEKLMRLLKTD
jgi:hypothetical protein